MAQPAIFFGHGSPMNALGGPFAETWRALGEAVGKPKGVVMVSAHWETEGLAVTAQSNPEPFMISVVSRMNCTRCNIPPRDLRNSPPASPT